MADQKGEIATCRQPEIQRQEQVLHDIVLSTMREQRMRRLFEYIVMALLLSAAIAGCADNREVLLKAESLMLEQPDSALSLLNGIDARTLTTRHTQAKYALLLSQALDKNYVDKTDFGILQPAIDYYEAHGPIEEQFLTLYYRGRIEANSGNYIGAMLSYTKAEELVPFISDDYSVGLLYAQMGVIYETLYDYPKSLSSYQNALRYYQSAGKTTLQYYTKSDIGQLYLYVKQHKAAEQYLTDVLQWGFDNQDDYICCLCIGLLNILYEDVGDLDALQKLNNGEQTKSFEDKPAVLRTKAYLYATDKDGLKAREYLDRAWANAKSQQDTINLFLKEYQINKELGQYRYALEYHEIVSRIQDSIVRHTLQQPAISAQKDYFQSQAKYNALKLKHNRQNQIVIVISVLIVILSASFYVRQRIIVKNNEISHYLDIVNQLEKTLFEKTKDADKMGEEIMQMNEQINRLFMAQFNTIDKLSNTYYEMHHTQRVKDAIYTAVKKEIDVFSSKESIHRLEKIVNEHRTDIMTITRKAMPQLSEMDFRLLCFIYAGFSAKAISIFTGDSVGNIYMKKSRLKTKIAQSDSEYKDFIIHHLS